jgi:8-oxo-dGTP diphosphatase
MNYTYEHPRPSVAADIVLLGVDETGLNVLLIRRLNEPFKKSWALPGGFVEIDEDARSAAQRELEEETGMRGVELRQFHTFDAPDRDPRGRVISVAHIGVTTLQFARLNASSDAADLKWFGLRTLPKLAFDHAQIIRFGLRSLRERFLLEPFDDQLLPRKITLNQLRHVYELVCEGRLSARRFEQVLVRSGVLRPDKQSSPAGPMTYSFNAQKCRAAARGDWWPNIKSLMSRASLAPKKA